VINPNTNDSPKCLDRYGTEIHIGSLLICEEHSGSVPGRVWLGVVVEDTEHNFGSGMLFQSANLQVAIHASQPEYWQVVLAPKGFGMISIEADVSAALTYAEGLREHGAGGGVRPLRNPREPPNAIRRTGGSGRTFDEVSRSV